MHLLLSVRMQPLLLAHLQSCLLALLLLPCSCFLAPEPEPSPNLLKYQFQLGKMNIKTEMSSNDTEEEVEVEDNVRWKERRGSQEVGGDSEEDCHGMARCCSVLPCLLAWGYTSVQRCCLLDSLVPVLIAC